MSRKRFIENSGLFMNLRAELKRALDLEGQNFVLAVSGGPDSLFLAYFFIWLRDLEDIEISLAHFNHNLRPGYDQEESITLRDFAREWQVEYLEEEADVLALARERKAGIEEAARFARHKFLRRVRDDKRTNGDQVYICLGHNLDDLIETMLINWGRGSGPAGLASMPYCDGVLLRPLLQLGRQEIRDFLDNRGLKYFTDLSNDSPEYLRNRIRLELVPLWEDILGYSPKEKAFTLSENIRRESDALDEIVDKSISPYLLGDNSLNLKVLDEFPQGLWYRVINTFLQSKLGPSFSLPRRIYQDLEIKLKDLPSRASFNLKSGYILQVKEWILLLEKAL